MSHHKKKHVHPVPPGNQPKAGPPIEADATQEATGGGSPFQEHDEKRRLGNFESAGEHSRQQPSQLNDGNQHSR
jgi:hypothetical protein